MRDIKQAPPTRPRPFVRSLAGPMAAVVCIALGLAALKNASPLISTITYNIAFVSIPLAIVFAAVGRDTPRICGVGFAAFGSAYFVFNFLALRPLTKLEIPQARPTLIVEQAVVLLQPHLMPSFSMDEIIAYDEVGQSLSILACGGFGAAVSPIIAAWSGRHAGRGQS